MTEQDSPGGVSTDDAGTSCTLLALSSSRGLLAVAETDNQPHGLTSGDRAKLSADQVPSPNATSLYPSSGDARAPVCGRRDCSLIHMLLMYYGGQTNMDWHILLFMDTKSCLLFCSTYIPSHVAFLSA